MNREKKSLQIFFWNLLQHKMKIPPPQNERTTKFDIMMLTQSSMWSSGPSTIHGRKKQQQQHRKKKGNSFPNTNSKHTKMKV